MLLRAGITTLLLMGTSGCAHNNPTINVQNILSECHTSNDGNGCAKWNDKVITVKGFLGESEYYGRPILVQNTSIIEKFDTEKLDNILAIEILVSQNSRKRFEPFLGKEVLITGNLNTYCVPRAINAHKQNRNIPNDKGEITIVMLTGACHYVTNPFIGNVTTINSISSQ